MRKFSLVLIIAVVIFSACKKETTAECSYQDRSEVATQAEIDSLQRYVDSNHITAIKGASGLFYTINTAGAGTKPGVCSYIAISYAGFLMSNGASFTNGTQAGNFLLGDLIVGWQKGLPLIGTGGNITLYIPPSLAYGAAPRTDSYGNVVIPANAYLKFTIALNEVK